MKVVHSNIPKKDSKREAAEALADILVEKWRRKNREAFEKKQEQLLKKAK